MTRLRRGAGSWPLVALWGALLLWSLVPLALLALQVLRFGGVLSGSDGMLAGSDQQQYLMFVRESGSDGLISNEYRLGDSNGVYLHPMHLLSGLLWRLGVGLQLALLIWKPVAALALAAGVWLFCGRFLSGRARLVAVVLALFYLSPVLPLLIWSDAGLSGESHFLFLLTSGDPHPALQLWGYLHAALTIGLMALFLLGIERVLDAGRREPSRGAGTYLAWTSLAGALVGWLHPWKGAVLLLVLAGLAAWDRLAPRVRVLAVPAAATALPIAYLALLPRLDPDWEAFAASNEAQHAPLWMLVAAFLPLAAVAALGARAAARDQAGRILLLWPPAALLVYLGIEQFPYHALQGLTRCRG